MSSIYTRGLSPAQLARLATRFWSNVDRSGGPDACWPWLGFRTEAGYGRFFVGPRDQPGYKQRAHRIAWELTEGRPFPEDKLGCHTCDNPPCCNPTHVYPGTDQDNTYDQQRRGRVNRATGPRKHPARRKARPATRDIRAHLSLQLFAAVQATATEEGVTMAEITRRALQLYCDRQ